MELIADILLVAGALGAGLYCYILARRLSRFNDLEDGVGGAVAVLSAQVDDLTKTLEAAQQTAGASSDSLQALTDRAEGVARRLELMVASMHDLPGAVSETAEQATSPDLVATADASEADSAPLGPIFRRHQNAGAA